MLIESPGRACNDYCHDKPRFGHVFRKSASESYGTPFVKIVGRLLSRFVIISRYQ